MKRTELALGLLKLARHILKTSTNTLFWKQSTGKVGQNFEAESVIGGKYFVRPSTFGKTYDVTLDTGGGWSKPLTLIGKAKTIEAGKRMAQVHATKAAPTALPQSKKLDRGVWEGWEDDPHAD